MSSTPGSKDGRGRDVPSAAELFKGVRPPAPTPPGGLPTAPGKPGPTLPKLSGFSPLLLRPMTAPKPPGLESAPASLPPLPLPPPPAEVPPFDAAESAGPAAEALPPPVPASAAPEPDVSTALLTTSSTPALLRAGATMLKLGFAVAVVVGLGFVAVKYGLPLLEEMRRPPGAPVVVDKDASTAVKVIQQTRAVVAKNDARVAQLDEVIAQDAKVPDLAAKVAAPAPEPAAKPVAPKVAAPGPAPSAIDQFLAQMVVGGVFEGAEPRAYLNGRIVKLDEIVERPLGLRFIGIDGGQKELWFSDATGRMYRRRY